VLLAQQELQGHREYRVKRGILEPLVRQEQMAYKGHRVIRALPGPQGRKGHRAFREYKGFPARMERMG
jgi:hypothetical protein